MGKRLGPIGRLCQSIESVAYDGSEAGFPRASADRVRRRVEWRRFAEFAGVVIAVAAAVVTFGDVGPQPVIDEPTPAQRVPVMRIPGAILVEAYPDGTALYLVPNPYGFGYILVIGKQPVVLTSDVQTTTTG